jgi:hypothetical protein
MKFRRFELDWYEGKTCLPNEFSGDEFGQSAVRYNKSEQLATANVFKNQISDLFFFVFDDLEQLDDIWMIQHHQCFFLSFNHLNFSFALSFVVLQNFYGNLYKIRQKFSFKYQIYNTIRV